MTTPNGNPVELAAAPVRTRSVAREGAAIPLPPGPLGHLRGVGADDVARAATLDATRRDGGVAGSGAGQRDRRSRWLIPVVAVACIALGIIIGVVGSLVQTADANQARLDAERAQEQVAADRADLAAQRSALEEKKQAFAEREKEVSAREDAVAKKESEQAALQNELDERQATLDESEQRNRGSANRGDSGQWDPGQWGAGQWGTGQW